MTDEDKLTEIEKVFMGATVPPWACKQWGAYEHDWLSCNECLDAYEAHLEKESES